MGLEHVISARQPQPDESQTAYRVTHICAPNPVGASLQLQLQFRSGYPCNDFVLNRSGKIRNHGRQLSAEATTCSLISTHNITIPELSLA